MTGVAWRGRLTAFFLFLSFLATSSAEEPQAKDPRWNDTVTAAPSETCISTVEQLEPLLRNISFYDDLRLHKGRGLNRTHLWQLVTRNSGIGRDNTSLAFRASRLVLIRNNTLYSPWLVRSEQPLRDRMLWSFAFFSDVIKRYGLTFPDVLFYIEEDDSCVVCSSWFNPVPAFTWFRHRPTYVSTPGVDAKINDLFLLAPTTDDADHKLYNYDWDKKSDKIFFRGGIYCHPPENIRENLEKEYGLTEWEKCARAFFFRPKFYREYADMADIMQKDGRKNGGALHMEYQPECAREDFDAAFYSIRDHARFKYLLALEGLTASHRFAKLLHTDSVVLKETSGWEEYYHAALTPWVHYVPVLNGTIWDPFYIVGNFTRDGREGDFRAIAKRAQEFAGTYLCHRARALYWLRLLQEYRGLFRGGEEMDAFISELEASRAGNWSTMQRFESKDYQDGGTPHLLRHGGGDEAGGGRR